LPDKVTALTERVMRTMFVSKVKVVTAAVVFAGLLAAGASALPYYARAHRPAAEETESLAYAPSPAPGAPAEPTPPATSVRHTAAVSSVAFSPNGKFLATGGEDHVVKVWNVATRKLVWTLAGHKNQVFALAFSPDGEMLASVSSNNREIGRGNNPAAVKL